MRKWVVGGIAALLIALGVGWYFASPSMTLSSMRDAAEAGDADRLAAYIDFPALRTSMKEELKAKMAAEIAKQDNNPFAALGAAIGMGMIDGMVDGMVTPASMRAVFSTKKEGAQGQITAVDASKSDMRVQRDSFDQFTLIDESTGGKGGRLIFKRDGLGWKLAALRLPDDPGTDTSAVADQPTAAQAEALADELEAGADELENEASSVPEATSELAGN